MENTLDKLANQISPSGMDLTISQLRYGGAYIAMLGGLNSSSSLLGILSGGDVEAVGFESFLFFMDLPVYAFGETASEAIQNLYDRYDPKVSSVEIGEYCYGFIDLLDDMARFESKNTDDFKWDNIHKGQFQNYDIEDDLKAVINYKLGVK